MIGPENVWILILRLSLLIHVLHLLLEFTITLLY